MWTILFVLSWAIFCMEFALWEEENAKRLTGTWPYLGCVPEDLACVIKTRLEAV